LDRCFTNSHLKIPSICEYNLECIFDSGCTASKKTTLTSCWSFNLEKSGLFTLFREGLPILSVPVELNIGSNWA
jgi:hypothetical protein